MIASESVSMTKKEDFLMNNATITELNEDRILTDSCDITSDDEVWLVQCPKTINIESLNNRKIKLPGKTHYDEIESIAEEFSAVQDVAVGVKSSQGYCLKSLPIQGRVIVRERLKTIKPDDVDSSVDRIKKPHRVPFPQGLKQRHPLHGAFYHDIIELSDAIVEKLKDCTDQVVEKKEKKKRSLANAENSDAFDEDEFLSPTKIKREKKEKRKKSNSNKIEHESPAKIKRIKKDSDDETQMGLAWIKDL